MLVETRETNDRYGRAPSDRVFRDATLISHFASYRPLELPESADDLLKKAEEKQLNKERREHLMMWLKSKD
jgi:hypothetical protein